MQIHDSEIDRRLDLHSPRDPELNATLDALRAQFKTTYRLVAESGPVNREQALALTHLEQALQWAIAALVRPAPDPR